jgi:uncharacterized 2Fe-2S/4Fe-4S cluster protein (DUF4445 family)
LGKEILAGRGTPLIDILHEYGVEFPCGGNGTCGKCAVRVVEDLNLTPEWRLACKSSVESSMVIEIEQFDYLIQADETPFPFESRKGLGIAVDLGTTTLVAQLLDLESGRVLSVERSMNPQGRFGSDLISRLDWALKRGSAELTTIIRKAIGEMIHSLMKGKTETPEQIILVGNTVMHHLFCDLDIRVLSFYPFESPHLGLHSFNSEELGWSTFCNRVCFFPSIGSFVGSDILAGILSTGMYRKEQYTVLIDLGTNGEIVVGNRDGMLAASTAAGPAFEGAKISRGMLATTGAISSVKHWDGEFLCRVIGNVEPQGICGSGLIDAVSILLETGRLGAFGEILSGEQEIELAKNVGLTQKDIQEFQLAKAAIAAGLEILLDRLEIKQEMVDAVYIAGGFGSYINLQHVRRTGMLAFESGKMHKLGNTALLGAKMLLFTELAEVDKILGLVSHVNLESDSGFQELYVNHMQFRAI